MKRFKWILVALVILVAVGIGIDHQITYGGHAYYIKVSDPISKSGSASQGAQSVFYKYDQTGFDDQGASQRLQFHSVKSDNTPLKKGVYLKVIYSKEKGVKSYTVVKRSQIANKALTKIDQYQ
ncbi:YxeA family protein [Furfurilactobacillus curtus]|uniref:YxeA family protein n=1 Tax=Furfurilactobacillus curtus TaxID=1746200 RepID=A0ABQ5JKP9_9LACO